jgi:hypothetical protein
MSYILPLMCDAVLLVTLLTLVFTAVSRQISSRSDCGLAMDHCEGASADAYWPLRVLSFARMPRLERCRTKKLLQRLLCLFILPFLSFGLGYSPRQLTAATELNSGRIISFISFNWMIWGEGAGADRHAMDEKFLMSYRFILSQEFENYY